MVSALRVLALALRGSRSISFLLLVPTRWSSEEAHIHIAARRSSGRLAARGIAYCCGAGCRHPGAGAFLVSAGLLRQHGLLPGRLRSVGGDGLGLVLRPDRQLVQA